MNLHSTDADRKAQFTELFSVHHTKVLAYARRRLPVDVADDAVADAFLAAWRNLEQLSGDPLLWLYGLARGAVANQRRGLDRIARLDERSVALGGRAEASDHAEFMGWQDPFLAAFDRLSEPEREVLRITVWEGLGATEAARVLSCSVTAFKVRLHRARRRLRRILDADGTDQMVGANEPRKLDLSPRPRSQPSRTDPLTCSMFMGLMVLLGKELS